MADKTLELALRIVAEATGKKDINALVEELARVGSESDEAQPKASALAQELDQLANQQELINAFKQSRNELEQKEVAVTAAALALDDLKKKAQKTDEPFVQLARSIDAAEKDLEQLRQELSQQSSVHSKLQQKLAKSGIDTNNLKIEQRKLGAQFNKSGKEIDRYTKELSQSNKAASQNAAALKGVVGQVTALAAGYVGLNQVTQAVRDIFTTGDKFERLGVQFTALMGSFEEGQKATAWVQEFTKKTPLQLEEVSQAFVKLKAFGLDPMDGSMQAIVDQAFKLGGSFQEVEGISLALGQAWAKQKLQGEEILQLVERGVPVWDLLAQATGKNTQELQKLSTAGKLGRDTIKALMDEMAKGAAGSAEAQMSLLSGQISNAKDNLAQFYNLISTSGAMDWLKAQLTELNKEFAAMAEDGRLKQWAMEISDAIIAIGEGVKSTAAFFYEYHDAILLAAGAWATLKVGTYFIDMAKGAKEAITWLVKLEASQKAAAAAGIQLDGKVKNVAKALGAAGLAAAAALSVVEIYKLGDATWDLVKAKDALKIAQDKANQSEAGLNERYKQLSLSTGILIKNQQDLLKAEQEGLIVYDLKQKTYVTATAAIEQQNAAIIQQEKAEKAAALAAKKSAEETQAKVEPLRLTTEQALKLTSVLDGQAKSLDGTQNSFANFIRQADASIETLKKSGEQYQSQIALLEQLKEKYQEHQTYLDATAKGTNALEQAYKDLGLTSVTELDKTVEKSKAAFELIRDSKQPVEQIRDAFLQYAEAAILAAEASGKTVPEHLKSQAAALQLGEEYDKLSQSSKKYGETTKSNQPLQQQLKTDIDNTINALGRNREEVNKNTKANGYNGEALKALNQNQAKLRQQTELLNQVRHLENANLDQLKERYVVVSNELERLEEAYRNNQIADEEYTRQKERLTQVLDLLQNSINEFTNSQAYAQDGIEATTRSLIEQRDELDALERRAQRAIEYTDLYAGAHQYLSKEFDFTAQSADELRQRYRELESQIVQNTMVSDVWWEQLARTSNQGFLREQQIIQETLAIRDYTEELESSNITLDRVNHIARQSQYAFSELGDEQLDPLLSAIDSARERISSLRDDVNSTLNSLRDELDQLNDNQSAIEQRRYQQQQDDLEAKLAQAQQTNDQASIDSAKEALRLSQEIYRTKQAQFKEEAQARQAREQQTPVREPTVSRTNTRTSSTTNTVNTVTQTQVKQVIRLELVLPGGSIVQADLLEQFENMLLSNLEQIKASS